MIIIIIALTTTAMLFLLHGTVFNSGLTHPSRRLSPVAVSHPQWASPVPMTFLSVKSRAKHDEVTESR